MLDENFGIAISKGKGSSVSGKVYLYNNGIWRVISEHNYSDYPLIYIVKPNLLFWVIHGSHYENYKPHLKAYDFNSIKEIVLPKIMWDEKDYVMWRGISVLKNGKIFFAGQQGNIIYYENNKWTLSNNPYKRQKNESLNAKDLHDIQMFNDSLGWTIGKNGLILKFKNGVWNKYPDITSYDLLKMSFLNENYGWIVGKRGTILKYENDHFTKVDVDMVYDLNSVKTVSKSKAYIVGANSTLLELKDGKWIIDESIKVFNDNFVDIDVIEKNGEEYIWIIGEKGIYTNYHNLKFSFTDVTSALSLRTDGRFGVFRDFNNDGYLDLLTHLEDSPSILYKNSKGQTFSEVESYKELTSTSTKQFASDDFDNDGSIDLLELSGPRNNQLIFGNNNFSFRNVDIKEFINENTFKGEINLLSAQTADFNNDGNVDIYISSENYDMLLKNKGAGKFENIFHKTGIKKIANGSLSSVTLSDFDNNNFVDVLITYKIPVNNKHVFLYLNKGDFKFIEKDDSTFYSKNSLSTYSSLANDFNNDGFTDIVIFNNENELKFLVNDGNANFIDVTSKIGFTEKFFHPEPSCGILAASDVNNDGWLDLFVSSKLYLNSPNFFFKEIGRYTGINFVGNPTFADYDNDGDMDLFIGSSKLALGEGVRAVLYRNNSIKNSFIKVRLFGDISNRFAVGAKVYLLGYDSNDSLVYITLRQNGFGGNALS